MKHAWGAVYRLAHLRDNATILHDFDDTEAETLELVREVNAGHLFTADGMTEPKRNKIYSL